MLELTTNPGLEDVVLDELRFRIAPATVTGEMRFDGLAGHVRVTADLDADALRDAALALRSVHRAVRPLGTFEVPREDPLGAIQRAVAGFAGPLPELSPDVSFRVRCKRLGTHAFTSEDVERAAGAGVRDVLPRRVRLKDPDVVLRVDVRDDVGRVGVALAPASWSRRSTGPFRPTTSLRANLAWGLLAIARPLDGPPPGRLLDPFVGAGTILSEAVATWPGVEAWGSDLQARCAEGARENLGDRAVVRTGDARRLGDVWPEGGVDTVVTNLPFGRRMGKATDLAALYAAFLAGALAVTTPNARLVAMTEDRAAFNRALGRQHGWQTRHVRIVEIGAIYAGVFVLSRGS